MAASRRAKNLVQAFRIEVQGEAAFAAASRFSGDPERRYKWDVLRQLESHMKRQIAAALAREGVVVRTHWIDRALGHTFGVLAAALPWRIALRMLGAAAKSTVDRWKRLEREGETVDVPLFERLTFHEHAQCEFVRHELTGDTRHSLDAVLTSLSM